MLLALGFVSDGIYALAAGTLGDWMRSRPRFLSIQCRVSGGILLALGVAAALSGSARK